MTENVNLPLNQANHSHNHASNMPQVSSHNHNSALSTILAPDQVRQLQHLGKPALDTQTTRTIDLPGNKRARQESNGEDLSYQNNQGYNQQNYQNPMGQNIIPGMQMNPGQMHYPPGGPGVAYYNNNNSSHPTNPDTQNMNNNGNIPPNHEISPANYAKQPNAKKSKIFDDITSDLPNIDLDNGPLGDLDAAGLDKINPTLEFCSFGSSNSNSQEKNSTHEKISTMNPNLPSSQSNNSQVLYSQNSQIINNSASQSQNLVPNVHCTSVPSAPQNNNNSNVNNMPNPLNPVSIGSTSSTDSNHQPNSVHTNFGEYSNPQSNVDSGVGSVTQHMQPLTPSQTGANFPGKNNTPPPGHPSSGQNHVNPGQPSNNLPQHIMGSGNQPSPQADQQQHNQPPQHYMQQNNPNFPGASNNPNIQFNGMQPSPGYNASSLPNNNNTPQLYNNPAASPLVSNGYQRMPIPSPRMPVQGVRQISPNITCSQAQNIRGQGPMTPGGTYIMPSPGGQYGQMPHNQGHTNQNSLPNSNAGYIPPSPQNNPMPSPAGNMNPHTPSNNNHYSVPTPPTPRDRINSNPPSVQNGNTQLTDQQTKQQKLDSLSQIDKFIDSSTNVANPVGLRTNQKNDPNTGPIQTNQPQPGMAPSPGMTHTSNPRVQLPTTSNPIVPSPVPIPVPSPGMMGCSPVSNPAMSPMGPRHYIPGTPMQVPSPSRAGPGMTSPGVRPLGPDGQPTGAVTPGMPPTNEVMLRQQQAMHAMALQQQAYMRNAYGPYGAYYHQFASSPYARMYGYPYGHMAPNDPRYAQYMLEYQRQHALKVQMYHVHMARQQQQQAQQQVQMKNGNAPRVSVPDSLKAAGAGSRPGSAGTTPGSQPPNTKNGATTPTGLPINPNIPVGMPPGMSPRMRMPLPGDHSLGPSPNPTNLPSQSPSGAGNRTSSESNKLNEIQNNQKSNDSRTSRNSTPGPQATGSSPMSQPLPSPINQPPQSPLATIGNGREVNNLQNWL